MTGMATTWNEAVLAACQGRGICLDDPNAVYGIQGPWDDPTVEDGAEAVASILNQLLADGQVRLVPEVDVARPGDALLPSLVVVWYARTVA